MTTGSKIVSDTLAYQGVKVIFEYPGGVIAPILDELALSGKIKLIVTRNDQAASLMADAYSRSTGECGVCMATSGPGATNLITGIANAYLDSIPMVAITGQVGTGALRGERKMRQFGFQELDIVSVAKPITKWAYQIKRPGEIKMIFDKAFDIAMKGRKGPVLIDIPMDISLGEIDEKTLKEYLPQETCLKINFKDKFNTLIDLINKAARPVIIAGGGVISSGAENELNKFVKKCQIPVANTLMGQGVFPQDHYLSLGFMGCYGGRACNMAVFESDLVVGIGNRFSLRSIGTDPFEFSKNKSIVHIDIDESEISGRVNANIGIKGDARLVLKEINEAISRIKIKNDRTEWTNYIKNLKKNFGFEREYGLDIVGENKLRPQNIISEISVVADRDAIITSDVGQNQMWVAQFYRFIQPRTNLTSAGLGNMGYGLPAALAAKCAFPKRQVINITGDGSFQMNVQELAVAKQYGLHIKVFVMHNNTLGLVKQFQDKKFNKRAISTCIEYNPDFIALAQSYGIVGIRLENAKDSKDIVRKALKEENSVIVDCIIDSNELALPELEAGHSLNDQFPYPCSNLPAN